MFAAWVLALAVAAPASVPTSVESAAVPTVSPARLALATRFTDVVLPDQLILESNMDSWEVGLKTALLNNPGIANIEREFPGAVASAIAAGKPSARPYIWAKVKKAKAVKAKVMADMLDEAEMEEAMAFYLSPTGQRFIRSLFAKADSTAMASAVIERANDTGEVKITDQDGQKVIRGALRETLKTLSAADMVEIMKFEAKPAVKKMAEAGRKADQAMLEIFNTPDPVFIEQQNKTVTDALLAHVEKYQSTRK